MGTVSTHLVDPSINGLRPQLVLQMPCSSNRILLHIQCLQIRQQLLQVRRQLRLKVQHLARHRVLKTQGLGMQRWPTTKPLHYAFCCCLPAGALADECLDAGCRASTIDIISKQWVA